jgi:targeting protein for Xklp2
MFNIALFRRQKLNKPSMIKLKTTEEMEMECIEKLRKKTKHHLKANENSMKKAILCPKVNAAFARRAGGQSSQLTRPHEFHFQTDKRVKQHPMETRAAADQQHNLNGEDCEKEFWNSLRQHPPSPVRNVYKIPFKPRLPL